MARSGSIRLHVDKLDRKTILIEGTADELELLGHIILVHSRTDDCGIRLSSTDESEKCFSKDSRFDLCLHRLPCRKTKHGRTRNRKD